MKIYLLTIFIILLCFTAKAQKNELTIRFEPSFTSKSILTITETAKYSTIKLSILEMDGSISKKEERTLRKGETIPLKAIFSDYNFNIKGSIDTIEVYETIRKGEKVKAYRISMGNDGINVKGRLETDSLNKEFAFWSPKAGTENHVLITQLLALMDSNFNRKSTKQYLAGLKEYF